jgi:hypothetical protein
MTGTVKLFNLLLYRFNYDRKSFLKHTRLISDDKKSFNDVRGSSVPVNPTMTSQMASPPLAAKTEEVIRGIAFKVSLIGAMTLIRTTLRRVTSL